VVTLPVTSISSAVTVSAADRAEIDMPASVIVPTAATTVSEQLGR
jgi:hypothetical protein